MYAVGVIDVDEMSRDGWCIGGLISTAFPSRDRFYGSTNEKDTTAGLTFAPYSPQYSSSSFLLRTLGPRKCGRSLSLMACSVL